MMIRCIIASQLICVYPYYRCSQPIINILQYMEIDIDRVDFMVSLNSFHEELTSKLIQLQGLQIEFLRKFELCIDVLPTQVSLVSQVQTLFTSIEEIYKDVKQYFVDLKMPIMFHFFRKTQVLMAYGMNFLAQALIYRIDHADAGRLHNEADKGQQGNRLCSNSLFSNAQIQYSNSSFGDDKDERLSMQMDRMYEKLTMEQNYIQKMKPSKAVKELEELHSNAELMLARTDTVFEEAYHRKYVEFLQSLNEAKKPEELTVEFCRDIQESVKEKFKLGMGKAIHKFQIRDLLQKRSKEFSKAVQTDEIQEKIVKQPALPRNTEKLQNLLIKEKKLTEKLTIELSQIRRDLQSALAEKTQLTKRNHQLTVSYLTLENRKAILECLYEEKREELINYRAQVQEKKRIDELWRTNEERRRMDRLPKTDLGSQTDLKPQIEEENVNKIQPIQSRKRKSYLRYMQQATFGKLVEPEWVGKPVNIRSMTSELKLNIEEKFPQQNNLPVLKENINADCLQTVQKEIKSQSILSINQQSDRFIDNEQVPFASVIKADPNYKSIQMSFFRQEARRQAQKESVQLQQYRSQKEQVSKKLDNFEQAHQQPLIAEFNKAPKISKESKLLRKDFQELIDSAILREQKPLLSTSQRKPKKIQTPIKGLIDKEVQTIITMLTNDEKGFDYDIRKLKQLSPFRLEKGKKDNVDFSLSRQLARHQKQSKRNQTGVKERLFTSPQTFEHMQQSNDDDKKYLPLPKPKIAQKQQFDMIKIQESKHKTWRELNQKQNCMRQNKKIELKCEAKSVSDDGTIFVGAKRLVTEANKYQVPLMSVGRLKVKENKGFQSILRNSLTAMHYGRGKNYIRVSRNDSLVVLESVKSKRARYTCK